MGSTITKTLTIADRDDDEVKFSTSTEEGVAVEVRTGDTQIVFLTASDVAEIREFLEEFEPPKATVRPIRPADQFTLR